MKIGFGMADITIGILGILIGSTFTTATFLIGTYIHITERAISTTDTEVGIRMMEEQHLCANTTTKQMVDMAIALFLQDKTTLSVPATQAVVQAVRDIAPATQQTVLTFRTDVLAPLATATLYLEPLLRKAPLTIEAQVEQHALILDHRLTLTELLRQETELPQTTITLRHNRDLLLMKKEFVYKTAVVTLPTIRKVTTTHLEKIIHAQQIVTRSHRQVTTRRATTEVLHQATAHTIQEVVKALHLTHRAHLADRLVIIRDTLLTLQKKVILRVHLEVTTLAILLLALAVVAVLHTEVHHQAVHREVLIAVHQDLVQEEDKNI
jgi:hypothetical protein